MKDYCDPNPCRTGGQCIAGDKSFTCKCPTGYTGRLCTECKFETFLYFPCSQSTCPFQTSYFFLTLAIRHFLTYSYFLPHPTTFFTHIFLFPPPISTQYTSCSLNHIFTHPSLSHNPISHQCSTLFTYPTILFPLLHALFLTHQSLSHLHSFHLNRSFVTYPAYPSSANLSTSYSTTFSTYSSLHSTHLPN